MTVCRPNRPWYSLSVRVVSRACQSRLRSRSIYFLESPNTTQMGPLRLQRPLRTAPSVRQETEIDLCLPPVSGQVLQSSHLLQTPSRHGHMTAGSCSPTPQNPQRSLVCHDEHSDTFPQHGESRKAIPISTLHQRLSTSTGPPSLTQTRPRQ